MTESEEGLMLVEFAAVQAARDDLKQNEVEAIYKGMIDGLSHKPCTPVWQQIRFIVNLIFSIDQRRK